MLNTKLIDPKKEFPYHLNLIKAVGIQSKPRNFIFWQLPAILNHNQLLSNVLRAYLVLLPVCPRDVISVSELGTRLNPSLGE